MTITLVLFQTATANDAFYQGGGSSLRPLNNPQMRVIEEKLLIHPMPQPVCYRLRFHGRFLDKVTLGRVHFIHHKQLLVRKTHPTLHCHQLKDFPL